jgi:hypothetical protein
MLKLRFEIKLIRRIAEDGNDERFSDWVSCG